MVESHVAFGRPPSRHFPSLKLKITHPSDLNEKDMKWRSQISNLKYQTCHFNEKYMFTRTYIYIYYDRLHHPNNLLQPIDPIGSSLTTTRWHDGTAEDWTSPFSSTSSPQPPFLGRDAQVVWWDDSVGYNMWRIWIGFWCTRKYYVHVCVYMITCIHMHMT